MDNWIYQDVFFPDTTRKPRPGEVDGKHYHFVSRDAMQQAIKEGEFIEFTEFSGNMYGTSKRAVRDVMNSGRICILDIEIEGVKNIKNTDLNPQYVFIKPPSLEILEERLRGRGTETEESLNLRLSRAVDEMAYGEEDGNFDLTIVNDILKVAYASLENFLKKVDVVDSFENVTSSKLCAFSFLESTNHESFRFLQEIEDLSGEQAEF